ncbi:MAG: phosphoribosylanthranilate isomerase [Verrucomicrobiota bacterium]|nr:phosphoribosylanthranilate isomerase [Limisphaera sp.]MDW8382631.1 phosphoribosylanthranilate isomerase [Verrucomicrobiota bacterium]
MKVKVKICGITSPEDAAAAAAAGADMIGLMFYESSPRYVSMSAAAAISQAVPMHVLRVGVFVNPDESTVWQAITACGLGLLQFHGDEPPAFCRRFGLMCIKAFRIRDESSLAALTRYDTDAWLLDAWMPGKVGGTGITFNWALARKARSLGRPIFLAGGLTPENVARAIHEVQPFAVDVSSGVEIAPGRKCPDKMRAFVQAVREASARLPSEPSESAGEA